MTATAPGQAVSTVQRIAAAIRTAVRCPETFIEDSIFQRGIAPSFEEIAERFKYRSLATVFEHLDNLVRKGYIRREWNMARAITLVEDIL